MRQHLRFCKSTTGERIAWASFGQGPLLVVPPGWLSHLELAWEYGPIRSFLERLAEHHTVIWYDKPATGLSDRSRSVFSLDQDVADCASVTAELGEQRFDLFAYSQGGPTAIAYAARYPERVRRMVLFGTYANGEELTAPALQESLIALVRAHWGFGSLSMANLFIRGHQEDYDAIQWFARFQREAASAEAAAGLLQNVFRSDVSRLLSSVTAPTLVIHRRQDHAIPSRLGRSLAAAIPGARLLLVEGEIHLAWLGNADEVLQATLSFLDEEREAIAAPPSKPAISVSSSYQLVTQNLLLGEQERSRWRLGLAQIDAPLERFETGADGLIRLRESEVGVVRRQVRQFVEEAVRHQVNLLVFPELSIDLGHPELLKDLFAFAQIHGLYIVPGACHESRTRRNIARMIGPAGVLWEQPKHIPAILKLGGQRMTEAIEPDPQRRIVVATTALGRIAIVICRDFLDLDLRVELRHAEPPVDVVLNPAFTPVTADFEAAHFEARRSLYAYCAFCNVAAFGGSVIHTPEKRRRPHGLPATQERLVYRDVDLFGLRAERRVWERRRQSEHRFIQSTR